MCAVPIWQDIYGVLLCRISSMTSVPYGKYSVPYQRLYLFRMLHATFHQTVCVQGLRGCHTPLCPALFLDAELATRCKAPEPYP